MTRGQGKDSERADALRQARAFVPVSPVLSYSLASSDGIRLMRGAGADYAKLRYQGTTALDYARGEGDATLLQARDSKAGRI